MNIEIDLKRTREDDLRPEAKRMKTETVKPKTQYEKVIIGK